MGIPYSYSSELPARCLKLIDVLWTEVNKVSNGDGLGPLTSTFLLAVAMPMIVLPIERIALKPGNKSSYIDDSEFELELSKKFRHAYKLNCLADAPFIEKDAWRFAKWEKVEDPLNMAKEFPQELWDRLESVQATKDGSKMQLSEWAACLRNAIAHGGGAYLDETGRQERGNSTKMFAFFSGIYERNGSNKDKLLRVNVLRITEESFRNFLGLWVNWLLDKNFIIRMAD
jgi:hypothetical protein